MLILRTLQWGPQHGYAIGQTIRAQSADVLQVEAGSLYPALQRLAKRLFDECHAPAHRSTRLPEFTRGLGKTAGGDDAGEQLQRIRVELQIAALRDAW